MINKKEKINLLDLNRQSMRKFFKDIGEHPFRADQVMKWIYHSYCNDFDSMTNISKKLRKKLKEFSMISAPEILQEQRSFDGTIKWKISINNQYIETIYIPKNSRATLCISSQIGCVLECKFCATAQQGFNRNLRTSEIIGQIWRIKKSANIYPPITNIVIMGMGEPLLNLNNVVSAIEIMLDRCGFGLSKRHVTLSTSGIAPALDKLGNMINVTLAISLHASNDKLRETIMPINRKYNISTLLTSIHRYISNPNVTQKKITIEYIMLHQINDHIEHAHQLAKLLKDTPCKINLIPYNKFPNAIYNCSSNVRIDRFSKVLMNYGFITTIRRTRGYDINAACGQLVGKVLDRTERTKL